MSFHNVRLPEDVEKGAQGGPGFHTTIFTSEGGFEQRNINWEKARGDWQVGYGIADKEDFSIVMAFFYARHGRAYGFRFKDWTDYECARNEIAVTDGVETVFQAFKSYSDDGGEYLRPLTRLVTGTVQVWRNNVLQTPVTHYTVDVNTGEITFVSAGSAGHSIELACQFDVPVRFDVDQIRLTGFTERSAIVETFPIKEIREYDGA